MPTSDHEGVSLVPEDPMRPDARPTPGVAGEPPSRGPETYPRAMGSAEAKRQQREAHLALLRGGAVSGNDRERELVLAHAVGDRGRVLHAWDDQAASGRRALVDGVTPLTAGEMASLAEARELNERRAAAETARAQAQFAADARRDVARSRASGGVVVTGVSRGWESFAAPSRDTRPSPPSGWDPDDNDRRSA